MTYDKHVHGHVAVDGVEGPQPILLVTGDRVWFPGDHTDRTDQLVQVGDGQSNGFDDDGGCVWSAPVAICQFLTNEETYSMRRVAAIDARLLRCAQ